MFQFYFHKDRGLNDSMISIAQEANFEILTLTVDTITGAIERETCEQVSLLRQN